MLSFLQVFIFLGLFQTSDILRPINQIYLEVTNTITIERLDNSLVRIRTCLFAQNMEMIKRQPYHTEHFSSM